MGYVLGIPLLIVLAALQATIFGVPLFLGGRPDLILLAVVGWGLAGGSQESLGWGLIGGLLLDALSGLPFGVSAISLVLIAYLVSLYERRLWEASFLMPLGIVLIASLIFHFIGLGVVLLLGREVTLSFAISRVIMPSTFLNLIIALPVVQLLSGTYRRINPPEVEI
jgi:rod shape-determining protein MreD